MSERETTAPAPETEAAIRPESQPAPSVPTPAADPQDEARLRGISKSIVIGLGGTGHKVMLDVRKRLVRIRCRFESQPPDPAPLGQVLERNGSGRLWQAVVRDPDRAALDRLRNEAGISDVEEIPLSLEEAYAALLARPATVQ